MKNWKDKVLGIFAGIGVMALLMGNYAQQPKGVWEMHMHPVLKAYTSINTETGEVRFYDLKGYDTKNLRVFYAISKDISTVK